MWIRCQAGALKRADAKSGGGSSAPEQILEYSATAKWKLVSTQKYLKHGHLARIMMAHYHVGMSGRTRRSERSTAELIEQLGRCTYGGTFAKGLNPAQWAALRYFANANRFSQTVCAFALYHGTSPGTASQTVKALLDKDYLRRRPAKHDRRSFRLELKAKAQRLLRHDPLHFIETASYVLSSEKRSTLAESLATILLQVLAHQHRPLFGICGTCRHLRGEDCCLSSDTGYECGLLQEPLTEPELAQICVDYEPRSMAQVQSPS